MKVIFAAFGSYGDVKPFLWLAKDLMRSGHEALLIANPHFESLIAGEGVPFRAAGTEEDYIAAATPAKATGNRFRDQGERIAASRRLFTRMFMNPSRETYEAITENRTGDTIVIGHFYAYGARLAAEKYALPYINICLSPYWLKGFARPSGPASLLQRAAASSTAAFIDGQLFAKPFNALRAEIGLEPMKQSSVRWMFGGNNLCLFPDWFVDFPIEAGMKAGFAGFPMDEAECAALPRHTGEFLKKYDAPVVFTPGSAVTDAAAFFGFALEALARLGKPGIFLSRSETSMPRNLPENVLYADYLPLGAILKRCSALVHHGGIGTAAQALAMGIPQLVCPRMDEQRENARILKKLGICGELPFAGLSGGTMAEKLERLMNDPEVRRRGKEIMGREMNMRTGFLEGYLRDCGKYQAK